MSEEKDDRLDQILRDAIAPQAEGSDYTSAKGLTIEALQTAIQKEFDRPWPPEPLPMVVHPRLHDQACDLLGLPHGSPLTQQQMWEAADIEVQQFAEERGVTKGEILGEIFSHIPVPWPWG